MRTLIVALSSLCLIAASPMQAGRPAAGGATACPATTSKLPSRRYGGSRLWVTLPHRGTLRAQPEDGLLGTKLGWLPDRDRGLRLTVTGRRVDAPGRMVVRRVSWGYSSTGKGSWASAVAFPAAGCWRITGRAGPATVSYVVRVVG